MEDYINYITTLAVEVERPLQPVYGIIHNQPLEERIATDLAGFRGMGPVRVGNQAAEQMQHDAYGSVILGASHMFIDQRLPGMGDETLFRRLEPLGHQARRLFLEPDAGPWEYRGRLRIHTHSATMCWVACDRLARVAALLAPRRARALLALARRQAARGDPDAGLERQVGRHRRRARPRRPRRERAALGRPRAAARRRDERFRKTCQVIGKELCRNGFIMRYTAEDDFGAPETAFLVCQFWYADALAAIGETEKAREIFTDVLARANSLRHPQRGHPSRDRAAVGQHPADLLHGRRHQHRYAALAQLGRGLVRRLTRANSSTHRMQALCPRAGFAWNHNGR